MTRSVTDNAVVSFVYNPPYRELYHAVAGEGAFLNGNRIRVSGKERLADAILCTTPPSYPSKDTKLSGLTVKGLASILPNAFAVRMLGSVSLQLAYAASGRIDGYYEFGDELYNWIAGVLLVKEAGGVFTDTKGQHFTWGASGVVAGNASIQNEIVVQLNNL